MLQYQITKKDNRAILSPTQYIDEIRHYMKKSKDKKYYTDYLTTMTRYFKGCLIDALICIPISIIEENAFDGYYRLLQWNYKVKKLIISHIKQRQMSIWTFDGLPITREDREKYRVIDLYNKLNYNYIIDSICRKLAHKPHFQKGETLFKQSIYLAGFKMTLQTNKSVILYQVTTQDNKITRVAKIQVMSLVLAPKHQNKKIDKNRFYQINKDNTVTYYELSPHITKNLTIKPTPLNMPLEPLFNLFSISLGILAGLVIYRCSLAKLNKPTITINIDINLQSRWTPTEFLETYTNPKFDKLSQRELVRQINNNWSDVLSSPMTRYFVNQYRVNNNITQN